MKKSSIRPLLTLASACLLPTLVQAQTTLQSPAGQPGGTTAIPAGQSMTTPVLIQMSPNASVSQPFPRVSSDPQLSEPNTIRFRATAGIERDDNVLRTSTNKRSDEIGMIGLGLKADGRFSQQRIVADIEANQYKFNDLSGLDYSTLNYSAAWYWRYSNILEGIASADRRQFRDITDTLGGVGQVGRRTERNELLEGGLRFGGGWRALAGIQHSATRSSDPRSFDANPEVTSGRVGASYEFGSGSSIAVRYRRGEGEYSNSPVGSDFTDNEIESVVRWVATAKTTVDARLAYLDREHDGIGSRDFDGLVGFANVNWAITAKTALRAGYAHDLGSYLFGTGGHVKSDRVFIGPVWRPTSQIGVNLRYERENRRWVNVTGAAADSGRKDTFDVLSAGVEWEPRRQVTVSGTLRNERRDSTLPGLNYRANVLGVAVKLTL